MISANLFRGLAPSAPAPAAHALVDTVLSLKVTYDLFLTDPSAATAASPFAALHPNGPDDVVELASLQFACQLKAAAASPAGRLTRYNESAGLAHTVVASAGVTKVISATLSRRILCPDPPPWPPPPSPPPLPSPPSLPPPTQPPPPSLPPSPMPPPSPSPPIRPIFGYTGELSGNTGGEVPWWWYVLLALAIFFFLCCCLLCFYLCGREPSKYETVEIVKPEDDTPVGASLIGKPGRPVEVDAVELATPSHGVLLLGDKIVAIAGMSTTGGGGHAEDLFAKLPAGTHSVVLKRDKPATRAVNNAKRRVSSVAARGSVNFRGSVNHLDISTNRRNLSTVECHGTASTRSSLTFDNVQAGMGGNAAEMDSASAFSDPSSVGKRRISVPVVIVGEPRASVADESMGF